MLRSTHKTIQDYLHPAQRPSKRETARTPRAQRFGTILNNLAQEGQAAGLRRQCGLSVRDYMALQLDPRRTEISAVRPVDHPTPSLAKEGADEPVAGTTADADPRSSSPAKTPSPMEAEASLATAIEKAAATYRLPAKLIRSVIQCESNFDAQARSHAGAQGLMQLMPATARDLGVTDPFDIGQNIDGGARYLRQMLDRFDGDVALALAAYNAGPGTVSRYGGIPPYRETQAYVRKVLHLADLSSQTGTV